MAVIPSAKIGAQQKPGGGSVTFDGSALSYKGWERFRELQRGVMLSRLAFIAMDFRHPDELDTIFYDHFMPAVAQAGFDLRRIDENPPAGSIDNRLRLEVRRAQFAVVDLTHDNSGAYWEAGFAEALGRPVLFTCKKGEPVHFDTRQDAIRVTIPDAKQEDRA